MSIGNGILTEEEALKKFTKKKKDAHTNRINAVVLIHENDDCSDLDYFATGGGHGQMLIWDIFMGTINKIITNHKPIYTMEYLGNNRMACSANDNDMKQFYINIWDIKTG